MSTALFKNSFISLILFFVLISEAIGQDIPPNAPNLVSFSAGSLIIPMNKDLQNLGNGEFNLEVYGFVHYLLSKNIDLYWIIKSGKALNEADFTASVQRTLPTPLPEETIDFVSSAFVISYDEYFSIANCYGLSSINDFTEVLELGAGDDIAVYELTEDMELDARYFLDYPPTAAIMDDGTWSECYTDVFEEANLPYELLTSSEFFENSTCYTFIGQPHIEEFEITNADYITNLAEFLDQGGNYFANCSSLDAFESLGSFQTNDGEFDFATFGTNNDSYVIDYPDMAVVQFEGEIPFGISGTISHYGLASGNTWLPESYVAISNQDGEVVMSVADKNGDNPGGNITYFGGHGYSDFNFGYTGNLPSEEEMIQHRRLLLNAVFQTSSQPNPCPSEEICICNGESVEIGCATLAGEVFTWNPTSSLSCTDCPNPMANPTSDVTYSLTSNVLCEPILFIVNVEENSLTAEMSGGGFLPCAGGSVDLQIDFSDVGDWTFTYLANGIESEEISFTGDSYTLQIDQFGVFDLGNVELDVDDFCTTAVISGGAVIGLDQDTGIPLDLGEDLNLCPGEPLTIEGPDIPGAVYNWSTNESTQNISVTETGTYSLTVSLADCAGTDEIEVLALEPLSPVDLGPDLEICDDDQVILNADLGIPNLTYTWQDGSDASTYPVSSNGVYQVEVSDGCYSVSDEVNVSIAEVGEFFWGVPNAFSPNLDGSNEMLIPSFNDVGAILEYNFSVFNRWGNMVFSSTDPSLGWNGKYKGVDQDLGVYTWILQMEVPGCMGQGVAVDERGNFTLLR